MKRIISKEGYVYAGYDESNHGVSPEAHSLVLSGDENDIQKRKGKKNLLSKAKKISKIEPLKEQIFLKKNHTFLLTTQIGPSLIKPHCFVSHVIASLCEDFLPSDLETFFLFIDGKLQGSKRLYTRDLLARVYDLSKNQIKIFAGGDYDKRYPIVNYADCMARYYTIAPLSLKEISKSRFKRELQFFT